MSCVQCTLLSDQQLADWSGQSSLTACSLSHLLFHLPACSCRLCSLSDHWVSQLLAYACRGADGTAAPVPIRGPDRQLCYLHLLTSLAGVTPDGVAASLLQLQQACQGGSQPALGQLTDVLTAGLSTAASKGTMAAWQPACRALGRGQGGVLAGKRHHNDRLAFAAAQLTTMLESLEHPSPLSQQHREAGQPLLQVWQDLFTVFLDARDQGTTCWQVRRCDIRLNS